ncbi:hypothetical protein DL93DRAFT_2165710 [Clavulina sp. PMI_390]|nr:hypothetical protein DL93DRAFT_2165710 [Clavulina sp. PMI_390]
MSGPLANGGIVQSALTLASLPIEIFLKIVEELVPDVVSIVRFSQVSKGVYEPLRQHKSPWLSLVRQLLYLDAIPAMTLDPATPDTTSLIRLATRKRRLVHQFRNSQFAMRRAHAHRNDVQLALPTPHVVANPANGQWSSDLEPHSYHMPRFFLIPGGRWVLGLWHTGLNNRLSCWDLHNAMAHQAQAPPTVQALASFDIPSQDRTGVYIKHCSYSRSDAAYIVLVARRANGSSLTVFEVVSLGLGQEPDGTSAHFASISTFHAPGERKNVTILNDLLLIRGTSDVPSYVWDWRRNISSRFEPSLHLTCGSLRVNGTTQFLTSGGLFVSVRAKLAASKKQVRVIFDSLVLTESADAETLELVGSNTLTILLNTSQPISRCKISLGTQDVVQGYTIIPVEILSSSRLNALVKLTPKGVPSLLDAQTSDIDLLEYRMFHERYTIQSGYPPVVVPTLPEDSDEPLLGCHGFCARTGTWIYQKSPNRHLRYRHINAPSLAILTCD